VSDEVRVRVSCPPETATLAGEEEVVTLLVFQPLCACHRLVSRWSPLKSSRHASPQLPGGPLGLGSVDAVDGDDDGGAGGGPTTGAEGAAFERVKKCEAPVGRRSSTSP